MMGTPGKGDKNAMQKKYCCQFFIDGFISTSNSEQKEQTHKNIFFIADSHKFRVAPQS